MPTEDKEYIRRAERRHLSRGEKFQLGVTIATACVIPMMVWIAFTLVHVRDTMISFGRDINDLKVKLVEHKTEADLDLVKRKEFHHTKMVGASCSSCQTISPTK